VLLLEVLDRLDIEQFQEVDKVDKQQIPHNDHLNWKYDTKMNN